MRAQAPTTFALLRLKIPAPRPRNGGDCGSSRDRGRFGFGRSVVWPNPSAGVFHVACQGQLRGEVTDVHGRVVLQQTFEAGTTELDLTGYANGVYFLRLADGERR